MIDSEHLEPLRLKKAQVNKRMGDLNGRRAKIDRELEALAKEAAALETTLETLAKVYGIDPSLRPEIKAGRVTGGVSTKPEGTPTLYEMVTTIFNDWAFLDDKHEAQDIYEEIRKRWWSDAPRNSIFPSLWRFADEGRIIKDGTKYGPIQKNETPDAGTSDASGHEADFDDEIPF